MNDEIKEIRDYISCPQFGDDHYGKWGSLRLDQRIKIKDLLDYITNLQQENQKLKERCDYLQRSCDRKEEQRDDAVMEYMKQDDYKERNEKAIEIIEKYKKDEGLTMYHDTWQHLYPVYFALKGDDKK